MAEEAKVSRVDKARKGTTKFFREIRSELKKVIWPTKEQLMRNTITVLFTCLLIGGVIWIADLVFGQAFKFVLEKLI